MVFPHEYIVTKAGPLIIKSCNIYMLCMVLSNPPPCHTICMAMLSVNRFNCTMIGLLTSLSKEQKDNWPLHLPSLVFAYNAMRHSTTRYQPYELMFGHKAPTICDAWLRLAEYDDKFLQSKCEWVNQQHELILAANRWAL